MKKILLCLFFLTSLNFYSQVANMTHCAGDTTFNLTYHNSLLIGNLNPAETTVSYHLTAVDASSGINAISNPTNFIVPQNQDNLLASQTIYARINHLGNITTNYFNLIVNPYLMVLGNIKPIDCYSDGSIMLDVLGGQAPFICIINGSHNFYNFAQLDNYHSILPIPNLVAGIYNIEVIDAIGCHTFGSWTIEPSSIIRLDIPTVTLSNVKCQGSNDGAMTINATGGKPPYSYSIDDGATYVPNNTFTNLAAGKYFTYVKDDNGCKDLRTHNITEPTSLQVAGAITKPLDCISNAIVTITATGGTAPYTYSKDGITFVQSNVFDNLAAGTYTTYVKDNNSCMSQNPIVISPLVSLSATITKADVLCNGNNDGSITINATGGQAPYVYSLDNGLTYVSSNFFNNLSARSYNVSVKDALGCIHTMVATIVEPTILSMTAATTNSTASAENDGTITVNATGGVTPYSYAITSNGGLSAIPFQNSNIFTGLTAGSYGVKVRDARGCTFFQTDITIVNKPNSLLATTTVTPTTCLNPTGTITVSVSGGVVPYQYSVDNGINYTSSNVFTGLTPGTYSIKVRDSENNITSFVAVITPVNAPSVSAMVNSNILCKGDHTGSITAVAIGGQAPYTYSLDYSPYMKDNGNNSITFANLYAGIHHVTVQDASGCVIAAEVVITEPVSKLVTVTTVKNQTITINATGGTGNYKYAISPNLDKFSTNNVFSELTPGSYIVNTSDVNGCYITMNAIVDPSAPLINGQIKLTIEFKPGQTLADLIINGQNIKWYINQNPLTGKKNKTSEVPLPLTTVIVDGTTYYASQTINGIESTERLAVTVKSDALATNDFVIKDFTYYPNPVKNIFTVSNTSVIDEVILISIKGETLLTQKINSLRSEIDLSNFSKGVYFLKVKSGEAEKTVKVIKE
jgi:hypothetical protein